jgi:hypothetical protein
MLDATYRLNDIKNRKSNSIKLFFKKHNNVARQTTEGEQKLSQQIEQLFERRNKHLMAHSVRNALLIEEEVPKYRAMSSEQINERLRLDEIPSKGRFYLLADRERPVWSVSGVKPVPQRALRSHAAHHTATTGGTAT